MMLEANRSMPIQSTHIVRRFSKVPVGTVMHGPMAVIRMGATSIPTSGLGRTVTRMIGRITRATRTIGTSGLALTTPVD